MKKTLIFIFIFILTSLLILFILINNNNKKDTIKYQGKTYQLLEYNMDIFTYYFNNNNYYEEDIIHKINHNKWDIIYFNGDLFILDKQVKKATKYYSNDNNYKWFIVYEENDKEIKIPIFIDKQELKYLYNMENIKKTQTTTFDNIEKFIDIVKESEDGTIKALINLVSYKKYLYWKTEKMTDNDEEYIIALPKSLNNKIENLLHKQP